MTIIERRGFTLVEIMIVVAIVALLVGVVVPVMIRARINANETSAQGTLKSFASACESYAAANAAIYPTQVSDVTSGSPPYFSFNPVGTRSGYTFTASFGDGNTTNGYTVTATALPNTGNWDYQITTSLILRRSPRGENDWQFY